MTDTRQTDKEAIASLIGAKGAMESALRRIATLEAHIADQTNFLATLHKALGTSLHAQFYDGGGYSVKPIHSVIDKQIETLKAQA
jgi:hypothetical protein